MGATAFPHRQPALSVLLLGQCAKPAEAAAMTAWVKETFERLQPHLSDGQYTNFLSADEAGGVRQGYGRNYQRLVAVKRIYDGDNLFRLNHNIDPAQQPVPA